MSKRVAAIDLGTNSFLCLVAELRGEDVHVLSDNVKIVRVGEKVGQNKFFLPEALQRAEACLIEFRQICQQYKVDKIQAVATSAARDAKNGQALLDIGNKLNIPIEVIDGEREAELTFGGVLTSPLYDDKIIVVDVGGGSTEMLFKDSIGVIAESFDIGGVRLTEKFITRNPILQDELAQMRQFIRETIGDYPPKVNRKAVAVAGTPTTLSCVLQSIDFDESRVEGASLTVVDIENLISQLAGLSLESRSKIKGLDPKRADIIVAGAVILSEVAQHLGIPEYKVSTRGIRFGLAREMLK